MPKQFWGLTSCLALVVLLTSACQPSPTVTATFTRRTIIRGFDGENWLWYANEIRCEPADGR